MENNKESIKNARIVIIAVVAIYIISLIIAFPVRWKNCRNAKIAAYGNPSAINVVLQKKLCSPTEFLGF